MAYNRVIEVGRVASDLELKQTANGKSVTSFSLAVRKDAEKTDFFQVIAFGKTAEFIVKYFRKGDGIGIEGKLSTRQYEKNGTKITVTEIVCDAAFFAEGQRKDENANIRTEENKTAQTENFTAPAKFYEVPVDDTLPF